MNNNIKKAIALSSAVLMALGISACSVEAPKATATPSSNPYSGAKSYSWPKANMGNMPDPAKPIYTVNLSAQGTSVDYVNFAEEDVREYITKLEALGYVAKDGVQELGSGGFMFYGFNEANECARVLYTSSRYTVLTYYPANVASPDGAVVQDNNDLKQ